MTDNSDYEENVYDEDTEDNRICKLVDHWLNTDPSYVQLVQLTVIDGDDAEHISIDKSSDKQEIYIYDYKTGNDYTLSILDEPAVTFQLILDFIEEEVLGFNFTFELEWVDGENANETTAEFLARPLYNVPLAKGVLLALQK